MQQVSYSAIDALALATKEEIGEGGKRGRTVAVARITTAAVHGTLPTAASLAAGADFVREGTSGGISGASSVDRCFLRDAGLDLV